MLVEKILIDYLNSKLDVEAYMEEQVDHEASYVVVEKTGSSLSNHIYSSVFAVQSYGPSLYQAATLNEKVKTAMLDLPTVPEVASCKLNSDYNFTDTSKKKYRYQAVYEIVFMIDI